MPTEIELTCGACGGHHTLCLPGGDMLNDGKEYEYTCPETQQAVRRTIEQWTQIVRECSRAAVILREV